MGLRRLCADAMIRHCRMSRVPLPHVASALHSRWRQLFCVALMACLLVTVAVHAVQLIMSAWDFPRVACPRASLDDAVADAGVTVASRGQRVHLGNWSFLAPGPLTRICQGAAVASGPLLAIVPVRQDMAPERSALRTTWGSQLNAKHGQMLFFIQLPLGQRASAALMQEFHRHQDILLAFYSGDHAEDTYDLLVRKVVAGLRWYVDHCLSGFEFVLKADHDSYWNVASLLQLLRRHRASEPLVLGSVQEGAPVARDAGSKFFTPVELFAPSQFPPYVSGGPGYALSRAAAVAILAAAASQNPPGALWLEDVYLTGLLPEAAFKPCVAAAKVNHAKPAAVGPRFLHLHSDYIFICQYAQLTRKVVSSWPPLAMHRVQGDSLRALHDWMQEPGMTAKSESQHRIVYSRPSCPD